eukprot:6823-Pyramimonas_sp.AAC.1
MREEEEEEKEEEEAYLRGFWCCLLVSGMAFCSCFHGWWFGLLGLVWSAFPGFARARSRVRAQC